MATQRQGIRVKPGKYGNAGALSTEPGGLFGANIAGRRDKAHPWSLRGVADFLKHRSQA